MTENTLVITPLTNLLPGAMIHVLDPKKTHSIEPLSAEFIDNLWRRMRGRSKYSPNRDSIVRVMRAFVEEVSDGN